MEKRKPNVLVTVALVLLVLAAIVCLIIFLGSRGKTNNPQLDNTPNNQQQVSDTANPEDPSDSTEEPTEAPTEPPAPSFDTAALQADLDDALDGLTSKWQVSVVDLASGSAVNSRVNCQDDELLIAADLPELFIMATVYQQLKDGKLTNDQVDTLLKEMMREDKDASSNELVKLLGGGNEDDGRKAVNDFAKSIGCEHVEFNRLFLTDGPDNKITASDCATLLYLIAKGECVSQEASTKMQELMTGTPGDRIPAGAPDGATVAHMEGNITGKSLADAGIVSLDNGEYVIVILCNDPVTKEGSTKKCVELTELVGKLYE